MHEIGDPVSTLFCMVKGVLERGDVVEKKREGRNSGSMKNVCHEKKGNLKNDHASVTSWESRNIHGRRSEDNKGVSQGSGVE